jgi:7-cyano-7-deazaguanine reductase
MNHYEIPLGKNTTYPTAYDPSLLFSIARAESRSRFQMSDAQPFKGFDHWRAYELSWLGASGKPVVAMADIIIPASSPMLVESKSLKLYLNSLNQHVFFDVLSAVNVISADIAHAAGAPVSVDIQVLTGARDSFAHTNSFDDSVVLLDDLEVTTVLYRPDPDLLVFETQSSDSPEVVSETLASNLFRSNCPVTSQPDWGTILVAYKGLKISRQSLLQYIISYREHEGFHEHCVEQIFCDVLKRCAPDELTVSINFLRRGGLEINPIRSTRSDLRPAALTRLLRQ